jgi:hypothetical protein
MAIRHEEITKLWQAHASALTLLARTRCNAAEDCVQEAYVRLAKLEELPREPIAWLAMSGWMASATRDSKLASETSVLQTPSKSVAASPVAPTMKIKNTDSKTDSKTVSKTNSTSASSLHSVGNDEFGIDMIRDTLSVISKQQWDRRRLEERGFSISTQFYRSSDRSKVPYTSPSTRTTPRPHNSVWEIGRGDLDGIEL